jgi:hypothetical protein
MQIAIVNDLNAESLDFVALRFILEKKLGLFLPRKSVLDHLVGFIGDDGAVYEDGRITAFAAYVLRLRP